MNAAAPVWPRYVRFRAGDLTMLWRFVASPDNLRSPLVVALLLAVYVAGVLTPLPGHVPRAPSEESWWFLRLLDSILTGGALGRGALFSMGAIAPLLLSSRRRNRHVLLQWVLGGLWLLAAAALLVAFFQWRGTGEPGRDAFVRDAVLLTVGGLGINTINRQLVAHHGPQVLDVNFAITVAAGVAATLRSPQQDATAAALLLGSIAFISISAYLLLRRRASIEVEHIGSLDRRTAVLQLSPVAEPLLDTVAALSLAIYVALAGVASLLLGWRTVGPDNQLFFVTLAAVALIGVWFVCRTVNRFAGLTVFVGEESLFGTSSPRAMALRMFHNFWVVPGVKPGPDTEEAIRSRMKGIVTGAFLLFALWFSVAIATEYLLQRAGAPTPFPFGPVVFVLMLLTIVGYVSMLSRHLNGSLGHFKQLWRGRSRLLADTYPLARPSPLSPLALGADAERYWQEEKVADDFRDLVDWLKLAREIQPQRTSSRRGWRTRLLHWTAAAVVAVVVSFLAGAICVVVYPDLSRRDLALIILPTLVTTLLAPEPLLRMLRKLSSAHRD